MQDIFQYASKLISIRSRTEAELARKLNQKGYLPHQVAQTIAQLKQLGFIDDKKYAEQFVDYLMRSKPSGKIIIKQRMRKRGLPAHLIEQATRNITQDQEMEMARTVFLKKIRYGGATLEKEKIARHLYARGFSSQIIFTLLKELPAKPA